MREAGARNPEADKLSEVAAFDVLRFVLASAVMLGHMGVLQWQRSGDLAVQIFFALSGWLIGGILCNTRPADLSRFYFNRVTRIWVPYFFCVTALYSVSYFHEPIRSPRWFEFLGYDLTFTHNWFTLKPDVQAALTQMPLHGTGNHFWSLAVEEQFYLIAPLIITIMPFGKNWTLWIGLAAVAYLSVSQYSAISLGVLSAILAHRHSDWHLRIPVVVMLLAVAIVAACGLTVAYVYAAPLVAICVVLLSARPSRRNAVTRWLGGVSFPFYLNAWIGTFAFHSLEKHFARTERWYFPVIEFLCGVGTAAVAYALIDVPVMANRSRLYRPRLGWVLGGLAYLLVISGIVIFWSHASANR